MFLQQKKQEYNFNSIDDDNDAGDDDTPTQITCIRCACLYAAAESKPSVHCHRNRLGRCAPCRLLPKRKGSVTPEVAIFYLRVDFVTALQVQAQIVSGREFFTTLRNATTGDFVCISSECIWVLRFW